MAGPAKILLVEDEALSALYLSLELQKMGFRVLAALSTGEEALALARAERPDLILMDINLSGRMDGLEAVRRIKELFEVPVIFTTGYSDAGIRELAGALEPLAFLVKPLDLKELRRIILRVLPEPAPGP
jgi:two-component system, response regulator PdtaR